MSLVLRLTYEESADNTEIIFRDNSYGWGTDGDPDIDDIDDASIVLTVGLDDYTIDITSIFTAAGGDQDQLVFTVDAGDLGGVAGDVIPDVIYYLEYEVNYASGGPWVMIREVLPVIGVVRNLVYDQIRLVPNQIEILDELVHYKEQDWQNILNPLINYAHYLAIGIDTSQDRYSIIENIFTALQTRVTS